ncbi:PREDICTED: telomere repeats-binding bouquet formation protein 2 [Lepidothrix coronata]|uniref:Telomere repeats-binding bouquet formation protein 2 n=1 Tax=Lepidothrix coronata TaxID=321398 RepID=A0A6J0HCD1_9PASS|nr:PREDICTED: telomere repeats-binding bouquet formation protein 2 [Lepidothrix coronata]
MFRGRRAWFSQSVSPGPRGLWVAGGGALTDWLDAEYLFSSDATHPDTRRWVMEAFVCGFNVFSGKYFLDTDILSFVLFFLAEIRRKIGCFIWEQVDVLEEKPNGNPTEEAEAVRNGCEEEPEGEALDLDKSSEETGSEAPSQGEFPYRALQKYPMNNMVTGYTSSRDMKKYEGELHDFIPGTSGYTAYWVQTKISIYCERKTKMKRKL